MANLFKRLNEASIPRVFETSVNLLLKEVVGQRLAFLRKSHGGYNMPQACCQVPPFVPVLTPVFALLEVVGQNGLEPSTSRLSVVCSSQLSYWPILDVHFSCLVEISGIEPLTSCLQGRRSPS